MRDEISNNYDTIDEKRRLLLSIAYGKEPVSDDVDLQLNRGKEILLCVIKQGSIDRKVWDDGPQSVRQSLDEIFDVYLRNLAPEDFDKEVSVKVFF